MYDVHNLLVPACNGTENPFTVNGRVWLYCWHPITGSHVYLDVNADVAVWNREFHPVFNPEAEFNEPNLPVHGVPCRSNMARNNSEVNSDVAQSFRCLNNGDVALYQYIDEEQERSMFIDDFNDATGRKVLELAIQQAQRHCIKPIIEGPQCILFLPSSTHPYMSEYQVQLNELRSQNVIMITKFHRDHLNVAWPANPSHVVEQIIEHKCALVVGDITIMKTRTGDLYTVYDTDIERINQALTVTQVFGDEDGFMNAEVEQATQAFKSFIIKELKAENFSVFC